MRLVLKPLKSGKIKLFKIFTSNKRVFPSKSISSVAPENSVIGQSFD